MASYLFSAEANTASNSSRVELGVEVLLLAEVEVEGEKALRRRRVGVGVRGVGSGWVEVEDLA